MSEQLERDEDVLEAEYVQGDQEMRKDIVDRLKKMEDFVKWCLQNNEPAVAWGTDRGGRTVGSMSPAARCYYRCLGDMMRQITFKFEHSCSLRAELFLRCVEELGLDCYEFSMSALDKTPYRWCEALESYERVVGGPCCGDLFNALVDRIREGGRDPLFREGLRRQLRDAERNLASALAYNERLFERRSRLVVIRLDLGYKREVAQNLTMKELNRDLDRFLNNQRHNHLFKYLYGYIIKIEEGPIRRLHTHVVLYFLGSKVVNHEYLGDLIGRYWVKQITRGRGTFFNCNRETYRYPATGVIEHYGQWKRANLRNHLLKYLFKDDQHVQINGGRVFRRGVMPTLLATPKGRPRRMEPVAGRSDAELNDQNAGFVSLISDIE